MLIVRVLLLLLFCVPWAVWAKISFPNQELASEYVFPVFDETRTVLNRNVSLARRFMLQASWVYLTDEPIYTPWAMTGSLTFYWSEYSGIGVSGLYFVPGVLSSIHNLRTEGASVKRIHIDQTKADSRGGNDGASGAQKETVTTGLIYFDVGLAPHAVFAAFLDYHFSPFYGKISFTKTMVGNFSLYAFGGMGVVGFRHGARSNISVDVAGHAGLGQRIYINRYVAVEAGVNMLVYRGYNPIREMLKWQENESRPARPPLSEFAKNKVIFVRFLTSLGMIFLL